GDVDLAELVRDSVATAELASDEVNVVAEVREQLPAVRGDHERLRQVLMNLIDNAIKYSPAGDDVEVRAYAEDGRVRIDVIDRGPGIAREDQRLIFEKFGRVTTGNARPGTGLGLFIARSIAEAHGGTREDSRRKRWPSWEGRWRQRRMAKICLHMRRGAKCVRTRSGRAGLRRRRKPSSTVASSRLRTSRPRGRGRRRALVAAPALASPRPGGA